jgi:hypothetical protein
MLRRADCVRLYRDRRIFAMAAMVAIALVAPWFVYQYLEHGRRVYRVMLGIHVMKRFTAYLDPAHLQPWNFYFLEIWAELQRAGSQIVVGLGCLFVLLKTVRRRWTEGAVLVLWFGLPLAVMSTTTSKLYHYAHPFLPPLALAGGAFAAFVAGWILRVLDRPVAAYDALRTRLFGAWPPRSMEIAATGVGLLAFVLAAFTAAFERIGFAAGSTVVRSSSIARPALAGVLALAVAAPASVLQAFVVTAAISPIMPLAAYKASVQRTKFEYKRHREVRACLMRVMEAQKARGQAPPGVWVEARSISHIPYYYLRDLGPWSVRTSEPDGAAIKYLLAPDFYRPILISSEQYASMVGSLLTDRTFLNRAALDTGIDPSQLSVALDNAILGKTEIWGEDYLVLPGPYAECGTETVRLMSR